MKELTIDLPGDKSMSHRAVLYASLARGKSRLRNISTGRDVGSSLTCIRQLGVSASLGEDDCIIQGDGLLGLHAPAGPLDCGNSGTTMRLLAGMLAGQKFTARLTGDASLQRRPMGRVMDPLRSMGAMFEAHVSGGAPFSMTGNRPLQAIDYRLQVPSAQIKSAILLAGLYGDGRTSVRESAVTRDHTERMFPVTVTEYNGERVSSIEPPETLEPIDVSIPSDPSSAAFLIMAALLHGNISLTIRRVSTNPTRIAFIHQLEALGAIIDRSDHGESHGEPFADMHVGPAALSGAMKIDTETPQLIDEIPALAVTAACAGIPCTVRGAHELRLKESDRISLLVRNLRAIGCDVEEYDDGFASVPKNGLIGASIETKGDHRIAMAFGVAGLFVRDIMIDDHTCVDVSFPGFWAILEKFRQW